MTYSYYHKVIKGKSPKNAPTYIGVENETEENKLKEKEQNMCAVYVDMNIQGIYLLRTCRKIMSVLYADSLNRYL